jgi:hypothetical protein
VIRSLVIATIVIIFTTALSGCSWVALAPDADGVQIGKNNALHDCVQVGTTKARTKTSLWIFKRSEKKVAEELTTLARNDAPELGGNTVVAEGPISADGVQRFAIYKCPVASDSTP